MFVGVGASRVRDLFQKAKEAAPAIIFIDELDAIGRSRGPMGGFGGGHDEREQTLNQILTEMDGFDPSSGVIVISATNRPELLDPALLRPGRFDRRVAVQPPDTVGRRKILEVHTRSVPLADDVNLDRLAATTPGMVGADIANVVNEGGADRRPARPRRGHDERPARRAGEARARHRTADPAQRAGPQAHRVSRSRSRTRRHADAWRRPGPQGLDHPARDRLGRHPLRAGGRPLQLRPPVPARQDRRRVGRPSSRGDRLQRDHDRRAERHQAGDRTRTQHGRSVGDERPDRPGHRHHRGRTAPPPRGQRHLSRARSSSSTTRYDT